MPKNRKAASSSSSSESDSGPEDRTPPKKSKPSTPLVESGKKISAPLSEGGKKLSAPLSDGGKKPSAPLSEGGKKVRAGDTEEKQWILEKMRFVRISEFRGRRSVDIREHYEKDGDILPGKKGIALSGLQWRKLLEHADEITKALEE